jgi:hypothetical protein|tara:strand:- start:1087 stop:1221 length:135 start_codon:yes stop_codon:yes gene_type:complete
MGWQLSIGFYTGIMCGVCSQKYKDGIGHYLYLPFCFIVLDIYYD